MQEIIKELLSKIVELPIDEKINAINDVKIALSSISPFASEPVDCVLWVKNELVQANDYNPNSVAPPEMELLRLSIESDGYTQPIVAQHCDNQITVVDGFHRHRVGKECAEITNRVHGYLPIVKIGESRQGRNDLIAATIRHNRARGKHRIEAMSDIVVELSKRCWDDLKIAKELGMDADEVLRLKQITGLAELFESEDFSESWEVDE